MDLTSLLIGFAGGLMTFYTFHRKIQIENILQERTKWREQVRKLARDIVYKASKENGCKSSLEADIAELAIRLNPLDGYDKEIIETAKNCDVSETERQNFIFKVSKLLKADWERAKFETSLFAFLYKFDDEEIRKFRGFDDEKK